MRTLVLLVAFTSFVGCSTPTKKPDQPFETPRAWTLPPISQRIQYQQTHRQPPRVGKTDVEGQLVR